MLTKCSVAVTILLPQTSSEQTEQKRDKATQTDLEILCAQKRTPNPTIDFSKHRSKGKPKYAPLKYRCIPAGYETDPEEELLIPHIDKKGVGNCRSLIDSFRTVNL